MITIDWGTKVINVPKSFLTLVSGTNYSLDTLAFHIALKDLEDSEAGMPFDITHNHNTVVTLGGIQYARIIEMINGYTVTFEDGMYSVSLLGSNNNILDVVNLNQASIRANNSAGLINVTEVQYGAFNNGVTIDVVHGIAGTLYPVGTTAVPVNNLADALTIAAGRGFEVFYVQGNLTIGATDVVSNFTFYGDGATLNMTKTLITLTDGCTTSNTKWHDCKITGKQGGESNYIDCIIDGLWNSHCHFTRCGFIAPSGAYTIQHSATVEATHTTDLHECYSSYGYAVVDRNGTKMQQTYDNFTGRIKFINQNHATESGSVWIYMTGGTVEIDSSCTHGTFYISGNCSVTDNSAGATVDTTGVSVGGGGGSGPSAATIASTVWAHAKALTVGKFLGLK